MGDGRQTFAGVSEADRAAYLARETSGGAAAVPDTNAMAKAVAEEYKGFFRGVTKALDALTKEEQLAAAPVLAELAKDERFWQLDPAVVLKAIKHESHVNLSPKEAGDILEGIYHEITAPSVSGPKAAPYVRTPTYSGGGSYSGGAAVTEDTSFFSRLKNVEATHAVTAAAALLVAVTSAFEACSRVKGIRQTDEKTGQTHINAPALLMTIGMGALAICSACLGAVTLKAGAAAR